MDNLFFWLAPDGVVHGGRYLQMRTVCGTKVAPIGSGWHAIDEQPITCQSCVHELETRPIHVVVDDRGHRIEVA